PPDRVDVHSFPTRRSSDLRARRVVLHAQKETAMLKHNVVGTEHLLLGLIREGEGVAARALQTLGIDLKKIRAEVIKIIGTGDQTDRKSTRLNSSHVKISYA